jgi:hypothetical protein
MLLDKVKINPHNRVKILCHNCNERNYENETYADLHQRFRYLCRNCVSGMMRCGTNVKFSNDQIWS